MSADVLDGDFAPGDVERAEARAARGRQAIEKRWGPYREARLAEGLPATKTAAQKRSPRFLMDPEVEAYWMDRARDLGLDQGKGRTALRVQAKRLAEASASEMARHYENGELATPPPGDAAVLAAFWTNEATRWRTRARRDREIAAMHDEFAAEAENELMRVIREGEVQR